MVDKKVSIKNFKSLVDLHFNVLVVGIFFYDFFSLQIDNAILFCDIGGMKLVIKNLNDSNAEMRSISSAILATSLQKYDLCNSSSIFLSSKN